MYAVLNAKRRCAQAKTLQSLRVTVLSKINLPFVEQVSEPVVTPLRLGNWRVDYKEAFLESAVALTNDLPGLKKLR